MNSDLAIRVTGLSKLYHLGEHAARAPYKTLRDSLSGLFRRTPTARSLTESTEITKVKSHSSADTDGRTTSAAGNAGTPVKPSPSPTSVLPVSPVRESSDLLWALKDVNFEINRGEVVGIIGRNGAGKSTLLKILSRITDPTEGTAELHGRVGSLLEVGTGFHPELTGRENIYLNGAILGMKRAEIGKKFDEIVAFAEVEKFIDTPVKFYSSGMYVRLAFAVAAHLEPEILLVDEVLAVGDAAFQKKCLGKMGDVAKQGRTVLFVSHNMAAIRSLCSRAVLLEKGSVELDTESQTAISQYLDKQALHAAIATGADLSERESKYTPHGKEIFRCNSIALRDESGTARNSYKSNESIFIELDFECISPIPQLQAIVVLVDADGTPLLRSEFADSPGARLLATFPVGQHQLRCELPSNSFGERRLYVEMHLICQNIQHLSYKQVLHFDVEFQGYENNFSIHSKQAYFRPRLNWHHESPAAAHVIT